jgi:hypothetical protein
MARPKNSSRDVHFYLESAALAALKAEVKRLSTRPGKLLSRIILERATTFFSNPVQLVSKK